MADSKQQALKQFKERIADVKRQKHTDDDLEKWLRARRFNVDEAEKMYRQSMLWRKVSRVDRILDPNSYTPPEVLEKYYPGGIVGRDKENRPLYFDCFGHIDFKGLLSSCSKEEIVKYAVYRVESSYKLFEEETKKTGKLVNQICQIMDVEGFGRKQVYMPGAELIIEVLKVLDNNYPETLHKTYIINAPSLFSFGYNTVIKPFLSEDTRNKFMFLGSNWKSELREHIGTDEYPVHWGGKLTDPDGNEYCKGQISIGGDVPEEYYNTNLNSKQDDGTYKSAHVKHGEQFKVDFQVEKNSEAILSYKFFTESYSIKFEVVYNPNSNTGSAEQVLEESRTVNCHKTPENGNVLCEKPGTYQFRFDNRGSWINDKKLKYKIELLQDDPVKTMEEHLATTTISIKM